MSTLYLFATVAGTPVAISTDEVEAVVRLHDISPIPHVPAHISGLAALRSRVLTVIDIAALVTGVARPRPRGACHAVVCDVAGHSYGLIVDQIIDICEIDDAPMPVRGRTSADWQRFADGVVVNEGQPYLIVKTCKFVDLAVVSAAA